MEVRSCKKMLSNSLDFLISEYCTVLFGFLFFVFFFMVHTTLPEKFPMKKSSEFDNRNRLIV